MKKNLPDYLIHIVSTLCLLALTNSNCFARGVDPTKPPKSILDSQSESISISTPNRLSAIFEHSDYSLAIIDNTIVKEGDRIGGYVVTSIKTNEVELTDLQNKRIMLKLSPSIKEMR